MNKKDTEKIITIICLIFLILTMVKHYENEKKCEINGGTYIIGRFTSYCINDK